MGMEGGLLGREEGDSGTQRREAKEHRVMSKCSTHMYEDAIIKA